MILKQMFSDRILLSRLVLVASAMLCAMPEAYAQPLFHTEHDWTIQIDHRKFGIDRRIQEPGHWQETRIWLGGSPLAPETQYEARIAFLIPWITELYIAHTLSRFVFESYLARNRPEVVTLDRWILLSRRLVLPYVRGSPRIFDFPQIGG